MTTRRIRSVPTVKRWLWGKRVRITEEQENSFLTVEMLEEAADPKGVMVLHVSERLASHMDHLEEE